MLVPARRLPRPSPASCATLGAMALALTACGGNVPRPQDAGPAATPRGNPMGPSYVLIPLPTEDDALLGRVIPDVPDPGQTLEAVSRPNPCGDKLAPPKETSLESTFQYAEELGGNQSAGAILGSFGFGADASQATHFLYTIRTTKRLAVSDTNEYEACCKEKGCGYGFVSALIYGDGEYAAGEEAAGKVSGGVPLVASASGGVQVKTIDKKRVKGWLAAVVTVTDRSKGQPLGALATESVARVTAEVLDADMRAMLELERITTEPLEGATGPDDWKFIAGRKEALTEAEFARRYKQATGSSDLDRLDHRRNLGGVITDGVLFGAMGACTVGSTVAATDDAPAWYTGTVLCGLFTLGFGLGFVFAVTQPDGLVTDHELTESEARRYTTKYNQQVLKKFLREQQGESSPHGAAEPNVRFHLGAGSVGAAGSF